jgi:ankyrin repeat protein
VDAVDQSGQTPLHKAVLSDSLDVVELLLGAGARPEIADPAGVTPARLAERLGRDRIVPLLDRS